MIGRQVRSCQVAGVKNIGLPDYGTFDLVAIHSLQQLEGRVRSKQREQQLLHQGVQVWPAAYEAISFCQEPSDELLWTAYKRARQQQV